MSDLNNINSTPGFIEMVDRNFPTYRQQIYDYLKWTLSDIMTKDEMDVITKLIAEILETYI